MGSRIANYKSYWKWVSVQDQQPFASHHTTTSYIIIKHSSLNLGSPFWLWIASYFWKSWNQPHKRKQANWRFHFNGQCTDHTWPTALPAFKVLMRQLPVITDTSLWNKRNANEGINLHTISIKYSGTYLLGFLKVNKI